MDFIDFFYLSEKVYQKILYKELYKKKVKFLRQLEHKVNLLLSKKTFRTEVLPILLIPARGTIGSEIAYCNKLSSSSLSYIFSQFP